MTRQKNVGSSGYFTQYFSQILSYPGMAPDGVWNFFLKKKFLADTHVLFGATGTPVLDFW